MNNYLPTYFGSCCANYFLPICKVLIEKAPQHYSIDGYHLQLDSKQKNLLLTR